MLELNHELRESVIFHNSVVKGRGQRIQESCGYGEKRHQLDIWVVFRMIRDEMMNVMTLFPPSDTEAADKVRDYNADSGVDDGVVGYAHVSSIVGGEHELMPHETEE
jgi:hypothetical protein